MNITELTLRRSYFIVRKYAYIINLLISKFNCRNRYCLQAADLVFLTAFTTFVRFVVAASELALLVRSDA